MQDKGSTVTAAIFILSGMGMYNLTLGLCIFLPSLLHINLNHAFLPFVHFRPFFPRLYSKTLSPDLKNTSKCFEFDIEYRPKLWVFTMLSLCMLYTDRLVFTPGMHHLPLLSNAYLFINRSIPDQTNYSHQFLKDVQSVSVLAAILIANSRDVYHSIEFLVFLFFFLAAGCLLAAGYRHSWPRLWVSRNNTVYSVFHIFSVLISLKRDTGGKSGDVQAETLESLSKLAKCGEAFRYVTAGDVNLHLISLAVMNLAPVRREFKS